MRHLILVAASALLLPACCPFGYRDTAYTEWEGPGLTSIDVVAIKADCELQERMEEDAPKKRFYQMLKQECTKPIPFADRKFVNPDTGERMSDEEQSRTRQTWASALCPEWLESQSVSDDVLIQYCYRCFSGTPLSKCYESHGLHPVTRSGIGCKALSW